MRKIISTLALQLFFVAINAQNLYVLKSAKLTHTIDVSDIDSIAFTQTQSNDTLCIYKSAIITHKIATLDIDSITFSYPNLFPADDNAPALGNNRTENLKLLFNKIDPSVALTVGNTPITDAQFNEIKAFTDNLIRTQNIDINDKPNVFSAIIYWITHNIQYNPSDNTPYAVFKNRTAVCGGFSALTKIMLISQKVPASVVTGFSTGLGAHAWVYAYVGNKWMVVDPTFGVGPRYDMNNVTSYRHLDPIQSDLNFLEDDDFIYGFFHSLNINGIKTKKQTITVPFSALGYQIGAFSLQQTVPDNVKNVYLGKNIKTFGENESSLLRHSGANVENIFIDPSNAAFESYKGIIYEKNSTQPFYVPAGKKLIELKAAERIEKNAVVNHLQVKEIRFASGTKIIESYAIEGCPNLLKVYVPSTVTEIQEDAFYEVNPNVQIIRE